MGIFQARILDWAVMPSSRGSSQPRDRNQVSGIAGNSLSAEPQGKPKNIAVGSLSLFQWVFLTQESNWSLLYCRQILYQLTYQGGHNSERGAARVNTCPITEGFQMETHWPYNCQRCLQQNQLSYRWTDQPLIHAIFNTLLCNSINVRRNSCSLLHFSLKNIYGELYQTSGVW